MRRLAVLVYPDFQLLDATGPFAAFEVANRFAPGLYDLSLVAAAPGLVASSSGVAVAAAALPDPGAIDTLVVSGGNGARQAVHDRALMAFLAEAGGRARRIASVCTGAFLLAEAGLLDGRRATTHWRAAKALARLYPKVRVEADRIYVREPRPASEVLGGEIWTSAGISAGVDLALALIGEDAGEATARAAAQQLVVFHRRPGGQSQYSALLELDGQGGRFAGLLAHMREHLAEPLGVERLAEAAGMSPRNFARVFLAETGSTPAKAVERLRVEAARALLESGRDPIEQVARKSGFSDPERMRRAFLRAFGQPPQGLRRAARSA
jgi:transcriptional regulator GlxA family with amidase domain